MRWFGKGSGNIDDRRGMGGGGLAIGGGLSIVVVILGLLFGADPGQLMNAISGGDAVQAPASGRSGVPDDEQGKFVSDVVESTELVWDSLFRANNAVYEKPIVTLFDDQVTTACGSGSSASGPFYCPADDHVYIDLSFYDELRDRFGAAGDFAQAYVIAHEVGHHVQDLMGITGKTDRLRSRISEVEYNRLSVKIELQADYYAGVWAHHAQKRFNILEEGDIEEALNAANAIGDDRLQQQAGGRVTPDSFTHGTSAQRVAAFKKGFETGDFLAGNDQLAANIQ